MNNKAQVLVIFVTILPLLFLFLAYTIDITYINYYKNKLDNINSLVIDYVMDEPNASVEDMGTLVRKNDNDVVIKNAEINDKVKLELEEEVPSIFGRLIGKNKYIINSKMEKNIKKK